MNFSTKIELLDGAIRVNPWIFILNLILFCHFIYHWYSNYKKWGWKIDFWHLTIGRLFLFPMIILYPFNGSFKNISYTSSGSFTQMDQYIETAYLITATGYIFIYLGRYLYNHTSKNQYLDTFFNPIERVIEKNIKNINSVTLINIIALSLLVLVIYLQLGQNNLFDPRRHFQQIGSIRPIYNLLLIFYPLALLFTGLRLLNKSTFIRKIYFILLLILSVFLGTRMSILEPMVLLFVLFAMQKRQYIKLRKILVFGFVFVYSAFLLLMLRTGNTENAFSVKIVEEVFYGNSFSDIRDFGFLLSCWDGQYLQGKTYAAGIISFIPRELSEFREAWALGKFTARITEYNSDVFPGFRPGHFGESYFNFGLTGVMLLGIITGYILRYLDVKMKESIVRRKDIVQGYAKTFPFMFISALSISIGLTSLYVFVIINFLCFLFRKGVGYLNLKTNYL